MKVHSAGLSETPQRLEAVKAEKAQLQVPSPLQCVATNYTTIQLVVTDNSRILDMIEKAVESQLRDELCRETKLLGQQNVHLEQLRAKERDLLELIQKGVSLLNPAFSHNCVAGKANIEQLELDHRGKKELLASSTANHGKLLEELCMYAVALNSLKRHALSSEGVPASYCVQKTSRA